MKIIIDIPEEVKQEFDKTESIALKGAYFDLDGVIGKAIQNGIPLDSDYDKLMTISQQLAFENEERQEKIEKIKTEIDNEWANTHHMYPDYAGGLARASEIIDKHIGKIEGEVSDADSD